MYHSTRPYSAAAPLAIRIVNDRGESFDFVALKFEPEPDPKTCHRTLQPYGAAALAGGSFAPLPSLPPGDYAVFEHDATGAVVNGPIPIDSRQPRLPEAVGVFTGGTYQAG